MDRKAASISIASPQAGFLYVSRLAPGSEPSVVATITRDARGRNALEGISGLLAFDGEFFAQYVEGPDPAITGLFGRLARDKRHVDVLPLWRGALQGDRRFPNWRLGYLLTEETSGGLNAIRALRGDAAIGAFCRLTAQLDADSGYADVIRPYDGRRQ